MASKFKSPSDVELVAIYRLEFYKKQKNWKFCQDVCKKKPSETAPVPDEGKGPARSANSSKSILNKTYNLEADGVPSELNNAFLETDPAKNPPPAPSDLITVPPLHFPHKILEPNVLTERWAEQDLQWPELPQHLPDIQQHWLEAEKLPETGEQLPESAKNWSEAGRFWSVPEMPEQAWSNAGQEWSEGAYYPQNADTLRALAMDRGWPEPCVDVPDTAYLEQLPPEALLSAADDWLRGAPHLAPLEARRPASPDSAASFMRGAAAAPHSSELDLDVSLASASQASCLSARQLAARVGQHAAALRALLAEARVRDALERQRAHSSLTTDHRSTALDLSCEERPTRDIDRAHAQDACGAGASGRGRGRLHRDRLIGIGMGRPYRL